MSYKDAAQSAGITPETLCRWLARGKVESGLFHEFYESVRKALVHFELVHLDNIERSALGESKIIRQTVKYKGGEILNGLCLLFIHPCAPNLIGLRSPGTMPA